VALRQDPYVQLVFGWFLFSLFYRAHISHLAGRPASFSASPFSLPDPTFSL
jgi:hypothetical protein